MVGVYLDCYMVTHFRSIDVHRYGDLASYIGFLLSLVEGILVLKKLLRSNLGRL